MSSTHLSTVNYDVKSLTKEWSATGRKFAVLINGKRESLDALGDAIADSTTGYALSSIPNMSAAMQLLIPTGTVCRTPRLEYKGEGDMAELLVVGEQGLEEGGSTVGTGGGDMEVPPNTTTRFVYEPNDVVLAYGLPFRPGMKWDLTIQAPRAAIVGGCSVKYQIVPEVDGGVATETTMTIGEVLKNVGYDPTNISLMAVANIFEAGSITEQYKASIFQYLNKDNPLNPTPTSEFEGAGVAGYEYVKRILRGETSYRFWIPHVTVTTRYRTLPQSLTDVPKPGDIGEAGEDGGPPGWTNAPYEDKWTNIFSYWSSGPQVEFSGDFWVVEQQWQGFLDFDEDLYNQPYKDNVPTE